MSTTIDQRVVEMRFDNKQFESNVSTTMSTLEKLKKSLNLKGASQGLEDVSAAAKKCDVSAVGEAAEKVGLKFNAMYTIADQALRNITNSAMTAGKRIVSALTIDPIKTGFSEYETQINAIQTILANTESKGTTLDDVNGALDELNTYADKTIYNFTEMTRNIGTFTAAGTDLDTSVKAIKGIANLAAVSGSTSQQASTAMYQLSQAMASGTVKLMDWNSVVNAGMGGQVFQDALKETAKVHGVAIDDIIAKNGSFRESLSEGWLTTEILTDTLEKFTMYAEEGSEEWEAYKKTLMEKGYTAKQAEEILKMGKTATEAATKVKTFTQLFDTLKEAAQSGWTQTWEILVGDFEEAKELLTQVSDVIGGFIGKSAEARNELLENWKVMGGRQDLIDSVKNIFEGIVSFVTPIKEAFREIFPPTTAEQLVAITKGLKEFTAKLKLSDTASENLKRTFKGVFSLLKIVATIGKAAIKAIASLFGGVGDITGGILGVTAGIGDFLTALSEMIAGSRVVETVFKGIGSVFNFVLKVISKLIGGIVSLFDGVSLAGDASETMKDRVVSAFEAIGVSLESCSLFKVLSGIWKLVTTIGSGIAKVFGSLAGGLIEKASNANFSGIFDFINSISLGGIAIFIAKFVKGFSDIVESVGGFKDSVVGILDSVRGCFEAYQTQLKAGALMKIAGAVAILAAALVVLSFIDSEKLNMAIGAITMLFVELMTAMSVFSKISGNLKGVTKSTTVMLGMSLAVLILASALKKIANLDFGELSVGLLGVAGLMAILVGTIKVLGKGGKSVVKGATQMVIFAAAIKILASVCKDLSNLDFWELSKGLLGVGVLLAEVSLFMNTAKFSGKSITTATGIVILAAAIKILASVCKTFASMSFGEIGKGLLAIGALLLELAAFTKLTSNAKHVLSSGIALIAIAAAMKIFASAVRDMGSLTSSTLLKGLLGMAGALTAVTVALRLMPKNMIAKGVGLIAIATALTIMSSAINNMGSMSWGSVAKGLVTLGGAMLILALGLNAMKGTIAGSIAILVTSAALAILTPILIALGKMSWTSIAKGLVAIAGAFVIFGVAGALLAPLIPAILGLSVAMVLVGAAILAAGTGLLIFGAGLSALAVGFTAIVVSLGAVCTGLVSLISALVVGVITGLGEGIIAFCEIIAGSSSAIGEALIAVVLELCDVLITCTPVIADTVLQLIVGLLSALSSYTPLIVDSLFDIIVGILDGIADNIPRLIEGVVDIFMAVFQGAVDALKGIDPKTLIQGITAIGLMAGVVAALAAISSMIPAAMVGVLGMGVVVGELAIVLAALGALAQIPGLTWIVGEGGKLLEAVGTAIGQFIGGIAGGIAKGFTSSLPDIGTHLSDFMRNIQPFIDGAKTIDTSVLKGAAILTATVALMTGTSLLTAITTIATGGLSLATFYLSVKTIGSSIKAFSDEVSGVDPAVITASAKAANSLTATVLAMTGTGVLSAIGAILTGGLSISSYKASVVTIGSSIKAFSDEVKGVNPATITAAASAANDLTATVLAMTGASFLSGITTIVTGGLSLVTFSASVKTIGSAMTAFSEEVKGVNPATITAAASAADDLTSTVLAMTGTSFLSGITTIATGGLSLASFYASVEIIGSSVKAFSDKVDGVNPGVITSAAAAADSLVSTVLKMTGTSFLSGITTIATGGLSLVTFHTSVATIGTAMKSFSDEVSGINPGEVTAAASASDDLVSAVNAMTKTSFLTGLLSITTIGLSLVSYKSSVRVLGESLKCFSDEVSGVDATAVSGAVSSAENLNKAVTKMTGTSFLTGLLSITTIGLSLVSYKSSVRVLGESLKCFSDEVSGVDAGVVSSAVGAAEDLNKAVTKMTGTSLLTGLVNMATLGISTASYKNSTKAIGESLKSFSNEVSDVNPEAMSSAVGAAEDLNKAVTKMTGTSLLTGLVNMATLGISTASYKNSVTVLGQSIKCFSDEVDGINPGATSSAAGAAKDIVGAVNSMTGSSFLTSLQSLLTLGLGNNSFKKAVRELGEAVNVFSDEVSDINKESVSTGASAVKNITDAINALPKDTSHVYSAGTNIEYFSGKLVKYYSSLLLIKNNIKTMTDGVIKCIKDIATIDTGKITAVSASLEEVTKAIKDLSNVPGDSINTFTTSMATLGEKSVKAFMAEFDDLEGDLEKKATKGIDSFIDGVEDRKSKAKKAFQKVVEDCVEAVENKTKAFKTAGKALCQGLADGISANSYLAEAKAKAMAEAAAEAARKALDINSPSKVFRALGYSIPEGLAAGIDKLSDMAKDSAISMAKNSIDGVKNSIARIADVINSDIDAQPTIRPVLDLSDVKSGADSIGKLFGSGSSVGVMANVGAISKMMSQRNQNGTNDDVVSAIDKLSKSLGENRGDTYNFGDISYDDDSSIAAAVRELVRAAKVERRV